MKRETSFTDLERIGLLEEAMEMTEAKEIVRQASQTQCYSKIVEALKREYIRPTKTPFCPSHQPTVAPRDS